MGNIDFVFVVFCDIVFYLKLKKNISFVLIRKCYFVNFMNLGKMGNILIRNMI